MKPLLACVLLCSCSTTYRIHVERSGKNTDATVEAPASIGSVIDILKSVTTFILP